MANLSFSSSEKAELPVLYLHNPFSCGLKSCWINKWSCACSPQSQDHPSYLGHLSKSNLYVHIDAQLTHQKRKDRADKKMGDKICCVFASKILLSNPLPSLLPTLGIPPNLCLPVPTNNSTYGASRSCCYTCHPFCHSQHWYGFHTTVFF